MKYLTNTHKESYTLVARKRYMKNLLYVYIPCKDITYLLAIGF